MGTEFPASELVRLHFDSRKEWLEGRREGLGGSDAAAALGLSPWKSNLQLWLEKTNQRPAPDLSGNAAVELGHDLEAPVRAIFAAKHPEYTVENYPYDILYLQDRPWLFSTLDGELTEKKTGRRGIYEGKTATCGKKSDWAHWRGRVPMHYYCQILHQMLSTGWDFAWLAALLMNLEGDVCEYREYYFSREDAKEDLKMVLDGEEKFYSFVRSGQMPPIVLNGIS